MSTEMKLAALAMQSASFEAINHIEQAGGANEKAIDTARKIINLRYDTMSAIANTCTGMNESQLARLDQIAYGIKARSSIARDAFGVLSAGECVYVALAAGDMTLIPGYTIAQALNRLDADDLQALMQRWKYRD